MQRHSRPKYGVDGHCEEGRPPARYIWAGGRWEAEGDVRVCSMVMSPAAKAQRVYEVQLCSMSLRTGDQERKPARGPSVCSLRLSWYQLGPRRSKFRGHGDGM